MTAPQPDRSAKPRSMARSAMVVGGSTAISRVTGLVREQIIAYYFGAGVATDAFFTAFRIPNLLRDLFAEGALTSAFVPVFKEKLVKKDDAGAIALAQIVLGGLLIVVGALTLIGMAASPAIVYFTAFGFADDPEKFALTVQLTRIMFPFLLLVSVAALASAMLNSYGKFGHAAIAPTLFNLGSIAGVMLLFPWLDQPIFTLAWGVILGGIGQLAVQIIPLWRRGIILWPKFSFFEPEVRKVWALFLPIVLGLSAGRINILAATLAASFLADGAISYLNYAFRLMHFPLGVIAVALGTVALPRASELVAQGKRDELVATLEKGLRYNLMLILPSAMVMALLAEPLVSLIYRYGSFDIAAVEGTSVSLLHYSYGLLGLASVRVIAPFFYAIGDAKSPMIASLISVGLNLALYYPAILLFDHAGLAAATSIAALANWFVLLWQGKRKHGIQFDSKVYVRWGTMAVGALVAFVGARFTPDFFEASGILGRILAFGIPSLIGLSIYLIWLLATGSVSIDAIRSRLVSRRKSQ